MYKLKIVTDYRENIFKFQSFCVVIARSFPFLPLLRYLCAPAVSQWSMWYSSLLILAAVILLPISLHFHF